MTRVLIIQFKMLGDVLTSTVLADVLKSQMVDCSIDYLISKPAEAIVKNHPHIDNLILADDRDMKLGGGLIAFAKAIRRKQYDIVIDAYGKISTALITKISGAPKRIGYDKSYLSFAYTHRVSQRADKAIFQSGESIGSRLNLLKPLDVDASPEVRPEIYLTEDEQKAAFNFLLSSGIDVPGPLAMIAVLGSSELKSLPPDYMSTVIDWVADEGFQMILNYSPDQEDQVSEILEHCKPETLNLICFDAYPRSLREFIAILPFTNCLIGNEGGAVNMAKAVGTPTFAIFSPWIRKAVWNIDRKNGTHEAVHLQDYHPEIYGAESPARFKDSALDLYRKMKPDLFRRQLKDFLDRVSS